MRGVKAALKRSTQTFDRVTMRKLVPVRFLFLVVCSSEAETVVLLASIAFHHAFRHFHLEWLHFFLLALL